MNNSLQQGTIQWKKKIQIAALTLDVVLSGRIPSARVEEYKMKGKIFQDQITRWIEEGVHLGDLRNISTDDIFGKVPTIRLDFFDTRETAVSHIPREKFAHLFYTRMRKLRGYGGKILAVKPGHSEKKSTSKSKLPPNLPKAVQLNAASNLGGFGQNI
jgi:hypothetical protein